MIVLKLGNTLIIGDSYSTFEGYIPKGYDTWYSEKITNETDVDKVEQTWWYKVFSAKGNDLVRNDSYSGSTICNTVRPEHTVDTSFLNRLDKLFEIGFFNENRIDTVLIFGGTNDSWIDSPVGANKYENFKQSDLLDVLPACGYISEKIFKLLPDTEVCWLINTDLKSEITEGIINNAKHFGQSYIKFEHIDKMSGHPNSVGMQQIADTILNY